MTAESPHWELEPSTSRHALRIGGSTLARWASMLRLKILHLAQFLPYLAIEREYTEDNVLVRNGRCPADGKLGGASKVTLNPNAPEFIPIALKLPTAGNCAFEASSKLAASAASTPGKAVFDRSESSVSFTSDDEVQLYWKDQLPDDITPDFTVMAGDDVQGFNNLSFPGLSLTDINESSIFSSSKGSDFVLKEQQELLAPPVIGNSSMEKLSYAISSSGEYPLPAGYHHSPAKTLDQQIANNDQIPTREGPHSENTRNAFLADLSNQQLLKGNPDVSPFKLLASQFPGFAVESLAEVYFANAGDLSLTIDMLTHLEVDGGLNHTLNSKSSSPRNLTAMEFPALSLQASQNSLAKLAVGGLQQNSPYQSPRDEGTQFFRSCSFIPPVASTDFASSVRKMASRDSSIWKYDGNSSSDASIGSSTSSQVLKSSFNSSPGRGIYSDGLHNLISAYPSPMWLENGNAVANMYSNMRVEACDHAHLQNAYFEQARRAYLIDNKALAKELSLKGQLHSMQIKAAQAKAQESIYHQRNSGIHANRRELMIDLHGLHLIAAIHVLKRELAAMRNATRSLDQRLIVYICVGAGHQTRGPRAPAHLPAVIQHYLLEEEGLDCSEPQPGILKSHHIVKTGRYI